MAMTDILTGLTTGMIEGLPTPPLAAMVFQWDKQTPYMLDIGLAPIVGATRDHQENVERDSRRRPPEAARVAAGVEKRLQAEVPKQDAVAVTR